MPERLDGGEGDHSKRFRCGACGDNWKALASQIPRVQLVEEPAVLCWPASMGWTGFEEIGSRAQGAVLLLVLEGQSGRGRL